MHTCECGRPAPDATLCPKCAQNLQDTITDIRHHWCDLDTIRTRQTRYGRGGGRPAETPLPIDARFAGLEWTYRRDKNHPDNPECGLWEATIPAGTALLETARNTIGTWARVLIEDQPPVGGPLCDQPWCLHVSCNRIRRRTPPRDNIPSACNYLLRNADPIRTADYAAELADELSDLCEQLRRMIDRPADKWFAGPCDTCRRDLYARTGMITVICPDCENTYDVDARRAWLLQQAEDRLANASLLARSVSWLGAQPLTAERVRQWAGRGRIMAKGHETIGGRMLPTYRIGDALDLLAAEYGS